MRRLILPALLAMGAVAAAHAGGVGFLDKPGANSKEDSKFLPVDQAFEIQPLESKAGTLIVSWRIAPGYYLYRQRLSFELLDPARAQLGKPALPAGEKHSDEYFGEVEIYHDAWLRARLPLKSKPAPPLRLKVGYQGCAEAGLCYPPQSRVLELAP